MTLKDFTERYRYSYDPSWDKWRIPKLEDGKYYGDCEDFSLGILYYVVSEESLFTFWKLLLTKAKMHYVTTKTGGGHAVLQLDGEYIDNWTLNWVTKEHMEALGHTFHPTYYRAYQVALKMIYSKIRGIF